MQQWHGVRLFPAAGVAADNLFEIILKPAGLQQGQREFAWLVGDNRQFDLMLLEQIQPCYYAVVDGGFFTVDPMIVLVEQ